MSKPAQSTVENLDNSVNPSLEYKWQNVFLKSGEKVSIKFGKRDKDEQMVSFKFCSSRRTNYMTLSEAKAIFELVGNNLEVF